MNAVEIEEAVSKLVEEPFNAADFPYAFLEAFGKKTATLQRLKSVGKNSTNKTDVAGDGVQSVLRRNNIHIATITASPPLAPLPEAGRGEPERSERQDTSELILFTSDDGQTQMHLRMDEGTIWLSQSEIAELFQTTKQNVSLHAKNIIREAELQADSVVKESLTTAADGKNYSQNSIIWI